MFGAERPILGHVATSLTHKPDRCTIDWLTPTGFEETIVNHPRILETRGRGCQFVMDEESVQIILSCESKAGRPMGLRRLEEVSGIR